MKTKNNINTKIVCLLGLLFIATSSCERGYSDDIAIATFPNTAEVYTDDPIGLTDEFFISFDPVGGANTNGFNTDDNEAYLGTSSIRIDVPSPNDPDGGFIGGIFKDRGDGRNLTEYDALTFWAKGSTTATVGLFGFGTDFIEDKYAVSIENVELSTAWKKYIIPIPDASKLVQEKGMFIFSAGAFDVNNTPTDYSDDIGYTFWLDEIRFEKLGTLAQPRPAIQNGQDETTQGLVGIDITLNNLTQTFNSATGEDITVSAAPSYFSFVTSNPFVASVNDLGIVSVDGEGAADENGDIDNTAVITAQINGVAAAGSLTIESIGEFNFAPTPIHPASNVISIFSDTYANVAVDYYNGYFNGDGQTTQGQDDINIGDDSIIYYTDLNFVGIGTFLDVPTVDASQMTHIHVDINVQDATIDTGDYINFQLLNDVGGNETSGTVTISGSELATNEWMSFDIPLSQFSTLGGTDKIGLIFFVSDTTISNIYVDNIYFYNN